MDLEEDRMANGVEMGLRGKLQELLQLPQNSLCADCNEPLPTWASTNWGAFICAQCAGVHRSLGVEHSFVLSCTLDDWSEKQVEFMASRGNDKVNEELEYNVPKTIEAPFEKGTDRDTREKYIKAKYVDKLFCKAEGKLPRPPQRIPRSGKRGSNSSLANGVDMGLRGKLQELLQLSENSLCADCNEPLPTWASTNWGVFICAQCADVHRSLGVEHSFVLSCTLDDWLEGQVEFMASRGNQKVNEELEYNVPKTIEVPFEKCTDRDSREKYIKAKYVEKLFCKAEGKLPRVPQRMPRTCSRSSSNSSSPTLRDAAMVEFIGIVNIQLVGCKNLIVKDFTSSDPYCVLTLGLQSRKSSVKYKCLNPTYNEQFSFSWNGEDMLVVEVYDKDELSKDDHMGKTEVDLFFLKDKPDKMIECWYPITHRKHKDRQQGEVSLLVTFIPLT